MVNHIEQGNPQQSPYCVLEQNLFCALNQPRLLVPSAAFQHVQLFGKHVMIPFVSCNHLFQSTKAARFLPSQSAVHAFPAFAEFNAALLGGNQQSRQFSSRTRPWVRPVIETVSWQRFEDPHKGRVFLFPPLDEELSIAELSAKRLCCHGGLLSACLNSDVAGPALTSIDRKSTRLNSSHGYISYAVFCLKKKKKLNNTHIMKYVLICRRDIV